MPTTYEPIATQTLGSAAVDITFSSIPATYTDLRLILIPISVGTSNYNLNLTFNGDNSALYSFTVLQGTGTAAQSSRLTDRNQIIINPNTMGFNQTPSLCVLDVFSYTGSTFKTTLNSWSADKNGTGAVGNIVGIYRSTNAITSLTLSGSASNFNVGTTATLYGIKNA
jgi:hypothetical protein